MSAKQCAKCEKAVYPLEMIVACNKSWHKSCFRCSHCDSVISLKSFATIDDRPYCKPHYLELFKSKGNYRALQGGGNSNISSSYNASVGFKGVGVPASSSSSPKASPKPVSVSVSPTPTASPQADRVVKKATEQHDSVLKEVQTDHDLKHPQDIHDSSAPHIESDVHIKKVDRKEILQQGVVEHPPKLRDVDELVNDRSAPVIEESARVKPSARIALFESIAKTDNVQQELKKPEATTDRSSPKIGSTTGPAKCFKCGKSVYDLEMLKACDKIWHKGCFRCKHCDRVLSLKGFATIDSDAYCKPHYLEIFKSKGTYKAFSSQDSDAPSSNYNPLGFKGVGV